MSPERGDRKERERERKKCHLKWPPTFMPAAKGSVRTPLGPNFRYVQAVFLFSTRIAMIKYMIKIRLPQTVHDWCVYVLQRADMVHYTISLLSTLHY